MQRTWADPTRQWEGFRPTSYFLDTQKVASLPLIQLSPDGKTQESTTIIEILRSLKEHKIEKVEISLDTEITTEAGQIVLKGAGFNRDMLEALLNLQKEGINGLFAQWF